MFVCLFVCKSNLSTPHCSILNQSTYLESPGQGGGSRTTWALIWSQTKFFLAWRLFFIGHVSVYLHHRCVCVCPMNVCVCVCLSHMSFSFILQLLYLPPLKGKQKAAGGGLIASTFEANRTKIKGGCQSGRKVVTHDSKSDLPLVNTFLILKIGNFKGKTFEFSIYWCS